MKKIAANPLAAMCRRTLLMRSWSRRSASVGTLQRARLKLRTGSAISISGGISGAATAGDRKPWISSIHGQIQHSRITPTSVGSNRPSMQLHSACFQGNTSGEFIWQFG